MSEMAGERNRMRAGWRRIAQATAALLVIAVLVFSGHSLGVLGGGGSGADPSAAQTAQEMPPMPVDVDTARRSRIVDYVRATGRVEAVQAIELRPDESGRITRLLFREGQSVAAGTPLVRIDDAMLRAQAERARAERELARQQLDRVLRLRADNAATPADVERAEANARSAEASLAVLELQVERTVVRAPFAGVVGQRFVSAGDYATPATRLLALQTVDPQRVVIEVPERHAESLGPGQSIEFTVAAQPERVFSAEVDFVDPVVDAETRTIVVKATAPNPDHALKAGMFVEARLATDTRPGAVVVREDAIQPLRTANVVWAVVDGTARRRVVQLGTRSEGVVEILSGVDAGELVVVGGLDRMAEGMPVAPRSPTGEEAARSPGGAGAP